MHVLRPGVSACLRRFRSLIISTTQNAWADYVRRTNPELGAGHDLDRFLFGAERTALRHLAPALLELQQGRCFYTGAPIAQGHVDHFIPWSRFPFDSPLNLVVASTSANLQKSDHLAALPHLRRWRDRNKALSADLGTLGAGSEDTRRCVEIARFSYSQAARTNSLGWLRGRQMQELDGWAHVLGDEA